MGLIVDMKSISLKMSQLSAIKEVGKVQRQNLVY